MKWLFCHDTYYAAAPDGEVYAHGAFPSKLWTERFLPHCDQLTVIGRNAPFKRGDEKRFPLSSAEHIDFQLLENINHPIKRLIGSSDTKRQIHEAMRNADGIIIRGPSEIGMLAARYARQMKKPYAIEMSGCAFDHLWYHGSLIAKFYAPLKYLRARHMVAKAERVIYVTLDFLQNRYPTNGVTEIASNVELDLPATPPTHSDEPFIIGLVGQYQNKLKGLDIALEALAQIKEDLPQNFEFRVLGPGDTQRWKPQIKQYGLERHVIFCPAVPDTTSVNKFLDRLSLYIQPSRHEGLPRALIEAMARGCPALASDAGGSAELLPTDCIHAKGNAKMLATHILTALDQNWHAEHSKRNFETAKAYSRDVLIPRRHKFWANFKETTSGQSE